MPKKLERITGVWLRDGKNGKKFMVGKQNKVEVINALKEIDTEDVTFFLFKNNRKEKDIHPDYNICITATNAQKSEKETKKEEVADKAPF